jgi:hypothetical protein
MLLHLIEVWLEPLRRPGPQLWLLAVVLVGGPLLLLRLLFARPSGGIKPLKWGTNWRTLTLGDPLLVRLVRWLFGGRLAQMGSWYGVAPSARLAEQLAWVGLEQVTPGTWLALCGLLLFGGALLLALLARLLGLPPLLGTAGAVVGGVLGARAPWRWLRQRVAERNALQVQQLVPWLQESATLLKAGYLPQAAFIEAIRHQRQARGWPRLSRGLDLLDELEQALPQLATTEGALVEVQRRCPQPQVRDSLREVQLALGSGARLDEALENCARLAQDRIEGRLLEALERQLPVVTMATLLAAFIVYAGTLFGVIGLDIVANLAHVI